MQPVFNLAGKKIWVAGHNGMVGSALLRRLGHEACSLFTVARSDMDLRRQAEVEQWLEAMRPDAIIIAAATVGGIHANDTHPAEFLYDNLTIASNIIHGAYRAGTAKLLFLGSSCIYPKFAPQPMPESSLLTGSLEPTNQWYALAKIAGIKLCAAYRRQYGCDFISAMPCNLYGINDNFSSDVSHVIPALMRRFHEARIAGDSETTVWGSGNAMREFLFSEDIADGLVFLLRHYSSEEHVNIGSGSDISIRALAELIAGVTGFHGRITFDPSKPDGHPRKMVDSGKIEALGWHATTSLEEGLRRTYDWFLTQDDGKTDER